MKQILELKNTMNELKKKNQWRAVISDLSNHKKEFLLPE